jgi:hypothetical protein
LFYGQRVIRSQGPAQEPDNPGVVFHGIYGSPNSLW